MKTHTRAVDRRHLSWKKCVKNMLHEETTIVVLTVDLLISLTTTFPIRIQSSTTSPIASCMPRPKSSSIILPPIPHPASPLPPMSMSQPRPRIPASTNHQLTYYSTIGNSRIITIPSCVSLYQWSGKVVQEGRGTYEDEQGNDSSHRSHYNLNGVGLLGFRKDAPFGGARFLGALSPGNMGRSPLGHEMGGSDVRFRGRALLLLLLNSIFRLDFSWGFGT